MTAANLSEVADLLATIDRLNDHLNCIPSHPARTVVCHDPICHAIMDATDDGLRDSLANLKTAIRDAIVKNALGVA